MSGGQAGLHKRRDRFVFRFMCVHVLVVLAVMALVAAQGGMCEVLSLLVWFLLCLPFSSLAPLALMPAALFEVVPAVGLVLGLAAFCWLTLASSRWWALAAWDHLMRNGSRRAGEQRVSFPG